MLATLAAMPTGPGWAFEFKWDGVRALTYLQAGTTRVISRNDLDITGTYPELATLTRLRAGSDVILDGEIVAFDGDGRPSFARLQERMHVRAPTPSLLTAVPVVYHVFDLLHLDGHPTLHLPYQARRDLLATLGLIDQTIRVPPAFTDVPGDQVLAAADAYGLEGVLAKRLTSVYRPGRRSPDWIKVPLNRTQEVVIIGYKPGGGRREGTIGSLVLAVHNPNGELTYAGGVGTGFTTAMLTHLHQQLTPLHRPTPPTPVPREHARGVRWVHPVLTAEVQYRNWTPDGRLRHPSWRGLLPDRTPRDARRPEAPATTRASRSATSTPRIRGAMQTPDGQWQVQIIDNDAAHWYRLTHAGNTIDWLTITDVEQLLAHAGIDIAQLQEGESVA